MATLHRLLKARFVMVRKSLDQALDHVTEDLYNWAPREGMRTIKGQLFEIAGKEVELLGWVRQKGQGEWEEVESFGEGEETLAGMRQVLNEIRQDTLAFIDTLSEAELEATTPFPGDWWEGLYLSELPLHEILRNIAMHEWYHTGQIVSYLLGKGLLVVG
jgi:uncharacterized damage-inducible protein DinB